MKRETRIRVGAVPRIESRANGKESISGEGIVFNKWSELLYGFFHERILPTALDGADMSDIIVKFNHDINWTLGRTSSGTASYEITPSGVNYDCAYDPTDPDHVRAKAKINRGDCKGSSFEFSIVPDSDIWEEDKENGVWYRTITKIAKVHDFAPVVDPAYAQTSTSMQKRSLQKSLEKRGIKVLVEIGDEEDDEEEDELEEMETAEEPETPETPDAADVLTAVESSNKQRKQPSKVGPSVTAVPLSIRLQQLKLMNAAVI